MSRTKRALTLLALLAALVPAAAGCGSDDDEETTAPEISVPEGALQTVPQQDTVATAPTPKKPSRGTKPAPPAEEDTATNDQPPPPGSPQEAFEEFCKKNPAACG